MKHEPRPTVVIKTSEGRRSDNRPVLPPDKYEAQMKILTSRGVKPPRMDPASPPLEQEAKLGMEHNHEPVTVFTGDCHDWEVNWNCPACHPWWTEEERIKYAQEL